MKKNVWIFNHYATNMFNDKAGRHYWFAENLLKMGYNPIIFCANTDHFSNKTISTDGKKFIEKNSGNIPFVFVNTSKYSGNGKKRIFNMIGFFKNLFFASKSIGDTHGKPDVILASSVHPLTLVAGIKIAKKLGIPCICEVRDLWPESLVAYEIIKMNNPIIKLLNAGEKWIYIKADKIIFTMEGGKDYLTEKGWNSEAGGLINLKKVYHLNNGVDLESFYYNKTFFVSKDKDLINTSTFKVTYTGSIRLVNNIKSIVDAALNIKELGYSDIVFLIYGDGDDRDYLENFCKKNNIDNIIFKGFVEKKFVPYILSKSNVNILHFQQNSIKKYGASMNKLFEYFASGKPTLSDCEFGYDLIKKYDCGIVMDGATSQQIANAIVNLRTMSKSKYDQYCENALIAAKDYDFLCLTKKLVEIIKN